METEAREISRAQCIDFTSIPQLRRVCLIDYFHCLDTLLFFMFLNEVYMFSKSEFICSKIQKKNSNIGKYFHNLKKNGFEF